MSSNGGTEAMSELESALDRLGEAVASLIAASNQGRAAQGAEAVVAARIEEMTAERDRLRAEVEELRVLHENDARLHADAAEAVKMALNDLRSLAAIQDQAG